MDEVIEPRPPMIVCPYCKYDWVPRVNSPKKCPRCQKWLPTPTYPMRFVPYDATGKKRRGAPFVGSSRGYDDGDIVNHPLEKRHETWWELVDEDLVPPDELKEDTDKYATFMVKADKAKAEYMEQLKRDQSPMPSR